MIYPTSSPCLTIIPDEIPSPYKSHIPCRLSPIPITKFTQHSNSRCRNTMREHLIRVYIKPKNTNPDFVFNTLSLSKIRTHLSEEILCYIYPETKVGENILHGKNSNLPQISPRISSIKCIIIHHEILIDLAGRSSPNQQCIFGLMAKEVNRIITITI